MCLKFAIPSLHAVDLKRVLFLSRTLGQVALSPLSVTGCDLLDTNFWSISVVPVNIKIVVRSSLSLWTTVGKLIFIVESASLVTTFEVALHTPGIVGKLVDPALL